MRVTHLTYLIGIVALVGGWVLGTYVYVWVGSFFSVAMMFYLTSLRSREPIKVPDHNARDREQNLGRALHQLGKSIQEILFEDAIAELLNKAIADQQVAANLEEISRSLAGLLHDAMRGLQFEDMASQNIHHNIQTLQMLEVIASALAVDQRSISQLTDSLQQRIAEYEEQRSGRGRNPVSATSMQSGEIELF